MQLTIEKSQLNGTISIPPSKSQTLRAILFAAMGRGKSTIHHYLHSPDTFAMLEACRLFGASCTVHPDFLEIEGIDGNVQYAKNVIDAGNSGLVLRFCAALGALGPLPVVVTGDHSIRYQRPMKPLLDGLSQLGVSAKSMRGDFFAPVIIQGPIQSRKANISGEDSQPVSALLIASAFAKGPIELEVKNSGEKSWVGMTLSWLERLGIPYTNDHFSFYCLEGNSRYNGFIYQVPTDWSTAAFPIAAALVTQSELILENLVWDPTQGDKQLISIFQQMGASIEQKGSSLHVGKGTFLRGCQVDINDFIDALPILSVVACFAEGKTEIRNAAIARQKESNRIEAIAMELRKMGAEIRELEDGLVIRGSSLKGRELFSHHDHRIALSLSIAGLGATGTTRVSSAQAIAKTFPSFLESFQRIGAKITDEHHSSRTSCLW